LPHRQDSKKLYLWMVFDCYSFFFFLIVILSSQIVNDKLASLVQTKTTWSVFSATSRELRSSDGNGVV
jgi:hypothetical protein